MTIRLERSLIRRDGRNYTEEGWPIIMGCGIYDSNYSYSWWEIVDGTRKKVYCPYFTLWSNLLKKTTKNTEYKSLYSHKNCSMCEQWKKFSEFVEWVDSQPNKDWRSCQIDKDLLVRDNKHYSPNTCAFINRLTNQFISCGLREMESGQFLLGVNFCKGNKNKPFRAKCSNPFKPYTTEHIGRFETEMEAHLAWKAKKHEYAYMLAQTEKDPSVITALKERYSPEADWTNNNKEVKC